MNTLSWLLYFGELSGNAKNLLVFLAMSTVIGFCLNLMLHKSTKEESRWRDIEVIPIKWYLVWVFAALCLVSTILPSSRTVYLIAASEMAEVTVTSEAGQQLINRLNYALDTFLPKEK